MAESAVTQPPAQEPPKAGGEAQAQAPKSEAPTSVLGKEAAPPAGSGTPTADKPAAQQPVVPEKYDLKLPEGSTLDAKHLEAVADFAKKTGLSNETAQKIVERDHAQKQAEVTALKEKSNVWVNDIKTDKELGGGNFDKSIEQARRALDKYGSEALKTALNATGLGNHPELVRAFARIGRDMAPDTLVLGGNAPAPAKKSLEERMYPNHPQ